MFCHSSFCPRRFNRAVLSIFFLFLFLSPSLLSPPYFLFPFRFNISSRVVGLSPPRRSFSFFSSFFSSNVTVRKTFAYYVFAFRFAYTLHRSVSRIGVSEIKTFRNKHLDAYFRTFERQSKHAILLIALANYCLPR